MKWFAKEKDCFASYDLIVRVSTDTLTDVDNEYIEMDIELQEDAFVAKYLASIGDQVTVGKPIAILCESEEDVKEASTIEVAETSTLLACKNSCLLCTVVLLPYCCTINVI